MKRWKRLAVLLLCMALLVGICSCSQRKIARSSGYSGTIDGVIFELADMGKAVSLHTELQNSFLMEIKESTEISAYENVTSYVGGIDEYSWPTAIKLTWKTSSVDTIEKYTVCLSETKDMSEIFYSETTDNTMLEIYNLKLATTYYWTVTAHQEGRDVTSETACFTTSEMGPRNLYIEGITNARDIGGWEINDGYVKQGMIYRCGRLNASGDDTPTIEITQNGIYTMREVLGIRSEIDLRGYEESGKIGESPVGSDVNYFRIPMEYGSEIIEGNVEQIKEIFTLLANEKNYPIVIHCNIGTDRTGLISFFVNGLLGVSENDLYLDYIFSNFGKIGSSRSVYQVAKYINMVQDYNGDTLSDKIYTYLTELGVSTADMDAMIEILTE